MRAILLASIVIAQLFALTIPALACPPGYTRCGTHYCCPR